MTLLVAYANTAEGAAALRHGRLLADKEGADLVVFDLDASSTEDDRSLPATVADEDGGVAARWFAKAADARSPADELIDLADQMGVDLIVVGVRRRSAIGKFVLGSNAQHIILDAHMPVLAVKADDDEH